MRPPASAQLPLGGRRASLSRTARPAALTAIVLVASLWGFALVVEDYLSGDPLVRWDVELARWLHDHSSPALVQAFSVITWAGNVVVLAAVTAVCLALLLRRRRVNEALFLAATALGIEVLNAGLKLLFHRPQPKLSFVHLDTYSFPSGHAAGSAAIYAALAFLLARSASRGRRVVAALTTAALIALIGFSRLYLGAHYLSDVLAGTALGLAWWAGCLLVLQLRGEGDVTPHLPRPLRAVAVRLAR